MIIDEVDIVGEGGEGSPEKNTVDEPSDGISILL